MTRLTLRVREAHESKLVDIAKELFPVGVGITKLIAHTHIDNGLQISDYFLLYRGGIFGKYVIFQANSRNPVEPGNIFLQQIAALANAMGAESGLGVFSVQSVVNDGIIHRSSRDVYARQKEYLLQRFRCFEEYFSEQRKLFPKTVPLVYSY